MHQPPTPQDPDPAVLQTPEALKQEKTSENFGRLVHFIRYSNYPQPIHAHGNIVCKPVDFVNPTASSLPLASKNLSLPQEQQSGIPLPAPGDFLCAPVNAEEALDARVSNAPTVMMYDWPSSNSAPQNHAIPAQTLKSTASSTPLAIPSTPSPNIPLYTAPPPAGEEIWANRCDDARIAAEKGNFEAAERLLLEALEIAGQFHNRDPRMPQTLDRLTTLYYNCGQYNKALACALETLTKTRNVYGHEDLKVASCMNNIAGIYFCQNLHHKAEPFCIEVLEIYKSLHDKNHADIGMAHNNLGFLYHAQGNLELAKEHYEAALPIRRQALGCQHPSVRLLVDGYTELLEQLGQHAQAQFIRATKSDTDSGWSSFSKQVLGPK